MFRSGNGIVWGLGWYGPWMVVVCALFAWMGPASALTGSGISEVVPLDTVSPTLKSAAAITDNSVAATFSEALLVPGAVVPGNYVVSGAGAGTLLVNPTTVTGSGLYTLTWDAGEMRNAVTLTLTASGVQDAVGNPLAPAANSASFAGMGTAPTFNALTVTPAKASPGETVSIAFTASESLAGDPEVTVNGHGAGAPYGKAEGYIFEYTITESDTLGLATIQISGADLAGNVGAMSSSDALEIIAAIPTLPLHAWLAAALLLLAAGVFMLLRKRLDYACECLSGDLLSEVGGTISRGRQHVEAPFRRFDQKRGLSQAKRSGDVSVPAFCQAKRSGDMSVPGFSLAANARKKSGTATGAFQSIVQKVRQLRAPEAVPFYALLFACSLAFAQGPTITNVSMTQTLTATSTQVDITYDLDAPNGPCDITVFLSRDGGTDGYSHAVTSVTGDLTGVTTGTGHTITWDIRADYPEEELPDACVMVTADDGFALFTLTYNAGLGGAISGDALQEVIEGNDGTAVEAVPDVGYHFLQWSDGVLTATRTDTSMTVNLEVTATFEINQYTLTYSAGANGTIDGQPSQVQTVNHGGSGATVTVVANTGYHFVNWSDGVFTAVRTDTSVTADISVTATFASNTKTVLLPGDVPLDLVWVPSGSFQMGRYPGEADSYSDEDPRYAVTLAYGFWMGKYEVTQQQWLAVRGSWPDTAPSASYGLGNTYPAYYISWHDTKDFITSLNAHIVSSGQGPLTVRLPSEAEWEYACRAGTQTRFYFGESLGCAVDCSDCAAGTLPGNRTAYMWYCGNTSGSKAVGGKLPNAFGLYDMSGNVYEFCEDDYHANYAGAPADGSPWIDSPRASHRVRRGGSWADSARPCRSAFRNHRYPWTRYFYIGFRLAAVE